MKEKRRFHRVRFEARCSLVHNSDSYIGQVVNISMNGALLSFNDGLVIPREETCNLAIYLEGHENPLKMEVEVVHSNFTMLGIKFTELDCSVKDILTNIIDRSFAEKGEYRGNGQPVYFREIEG
jgi:hypothetical protein